MWHTIHARLILQSPQNTKNGQTDFIYSWAFPQSNFIFSIEARQWKCLKWSIDTRAGHDIHEVIGFSSLHEGNVFNKQCSCCVVNLPIGNINYAPCQALMQVWHALIVWMLLSLIYSPLCASSTRLASFPGSPCLGGGEPGTFCHLRDIYTVDTT